MEDKQAKTADTQEQQYVNIKFPPGFAHPYRFKDSKGNIWDKAILNIPPNTSMNGIDITGYSVDIFLREYQMSQIANGEGVTCGFKEDEKIPLFQGKGAEQKTLLIDPWELTKAIKTQREEYIADKTAEREAQKNGPTALSNRVSNAKEASSELGGNEEPSYKMEAR